jgi:uncharacterized protein YcfL
MFAPVSALLTSLLLSACGSSSAIEVERSVALANLSQQSNFVVLPAAQQERARDFAKYGDQIAGVLTSYGLKRVEDPAQARYAVMFSYDGDGLERASDERHRAIPEKKRKEGMVERSMTIVLYDLTRPKMIDEAVFSGYADCSVDSIRRDPIVVPLMISAILKDFPGSNGRDSYSTGLPDMK